MGFVNLRQHQAFLGTIFFFIISAEEALFILFTPVFAAYLPGLSPARFAK